MTAATLYEFDVRVSDGGHWIVRAPSIAQFEQALRTNKALLADPPGTSETGWRIETAQVVAWRREP